MNALKADVAGIHSNLQVAESCFRSKEEQEIIGGIRETLPAYEKGVEGIVEALNASDTATASARRIALAPAAAQMSSSINKARQLKESLAGQKFQENDGAYQTGRELVIAASALALLLGTILSVIIARSFALPLGKAVTVLEKVAEGDLTASLDVDTKDEVGHMARALNKAVERLNATMCEVADNAANASSSSQQLAAASEAIASGAQEQAASLEETSASLEEITATVRQSSDNAQQASQLAMGSKDAAIQGQEVVAQAITAMSEINASSVKIADIISTIDEIAFQTNLLAVNAAVEAARAGDEGRGFAVVASEVRALALRSAGAAKEIKVLIQDSLRKVDAGSALVNRSGETLHGIVESVKRVTDIVGEMAVEANEQSAGVEQVSTAMTQMDQVTQSNSAQTEELSATAESLSEQAADLLVLVGTFNLGNGGKGQKNWHSDNQRAETHAMQSRQASHQPVKTLRRSALALAKVDTFARAQKPKGRLAPSTFAATPSTASSDASFEEF